MSEKTISFILFLIILVFCIVLRKSNIKNKQKVHNIFAIIILAFLVGYNVVSYVITTNKIFATPEELLKYKGYEDKVKLIVEGKNSFLVVHGETSAEKTLSAFPKEGDGWKDNFLITLKFVNTKYMGFYDITLMKYQDTDDYYILVQDLIGEELEVSDNYNTEFMMLETNGESLSGAKRSYFGYYAYIGKLSSDYTIYVNGKEIDPMS